MSASHVVRSILATAFVPMSILVGGAMLSACEADPGDEENCTACEADSAGETACIDAIRGCEETEETDTAEEHEACEEAANANCE